MTRAGEQIEVIEEGSARRDLTGFWKNAVYVVGIVMSLFHIYGLAIRPITPWILYCGHIGLGFILCLALYNAKKVSERNTVPLYDLVIMACTIFAVVYMVFEMNGLVYRIGINPTTMDIIVSIIVIGVTLEVTRRVCGNILPGIAIAFLLYARFGNYLPGLLGHRGYSWDKILSYMIGLDAIFSTPIGASARMVFLFVLFGSFLKISGATDFFMNLALSLTGSARGGPAKVAVVSSALFGTVSGNSVANVVSTGAFTIPLMKSIGYKPVFAGAVEAVASTGGQIMPPILGSAAFIMAQLIGVPYLRIVTASIIPALLYFSTVFLMVDLEAVKHNLKGLDKKELPVFKNIIRQEGLLIIPLLTLIYVLSIAKASPIRAAMWAIGSTIVVTWITKGKKGMEIRGILDALSEGAINSISVIAACGTAGIVIGVMNLTGTGLKFASAVISLSMGILPIALLLTMLASLILGMGLPTTASYLICAAVAAPALVKMGVTPLAAHMFVLYFACLSAITPPVALAAYAGAGIAKAKPMEVGFAACKIGISAFLVPFIFVYENSLLWEGAVGTILITIVTALLGVTMLSFGVQSQALNLRLGKVESIVLILASLLLIKPGLITDIIGFCVCAVVILISLQRSRRQKRVEQEKTVVS